VATQRVPVIEKIMDANDQVASINKKKLDDFKILPFKLMASPGRKNELILRTIRTLSPDG